MHRARRRAGCPRRWAGLRWAPIVAAPVLAALGACSSPPREPFAPLLAPVWNHHAGSILSGPRSEDALAPVDTDPEHALQLRVEVGGLAELPDDWPRLASKARLVVADGDDHSLRGVANLLGGALCLDGPDVLVKLEEAAPALRPVTTALLPGTTAALSLGPFPGSHLLEMRLLVARGDFLSVGLFARGQPGVSPDEEAAAVPIDRRELVIVKSPLPEDGTPLLVCAPLPQPGHPDAGVVLLLSVAQPEPGDEGHALRTAVAAADVRRNSAETRTNTSELTANESFLRQVVSAFAVLEDAASRRSALAFLAGASEATLCANLTLIADDAMLAKLAARIEAEGKDLPALVAQGGGLPWLLERSAWSLIAEMFAEDPLPPELVAEVLRQSGETGRFAYTLAEAVRGSTSVASLRARFVQENLVFLEDASASARVRAAEWLAARGKLPPGFNPLAPLSERRAALAAAEAAAAGLDEAPK